MAKRSYRKHIRHDGGWDTRRARFGETGHRAIRVSRLHQRHKPLRQRGKVASVSRGTVSA